MANEKRLIDANVLKTLFEVRYDTAFIQERTRENKEQWSGYCTGINWGRNTIANAPTVDAYSEEQVANLIQQTEKLEAKNKELEKEVSWLKSCINCKLRKECPRHCGKVVHDCDHWEHGDSTVDAVEVVHARWVDAYGIPKSKCTNCTVAFGRVMDGDCYYCPNCGAKMDGGNEDGRRKATRI